MRSLFSQASDYLKLRQTELERRLEFSEGYGDGTSDSDHPRRSNPLDIQDSCNDDDENNQDRGEITDPSVGGLARMTLEGSLNWKEFQQLYYESDLFKWHREAYLGRDGMLDLEEMKRIWIDNEKSYEKSFLDGARKRILQDGSKNAKKTRQRGMVM
ncbi:hypothetical protein BGX31_005114 [Mortierella sp. GBA43]|nr:hypothetical protein BGX31_005114 [Mortierella sp. GBA43]